MNNQQSIKWLIEDATDMISSKNLAQLEIIHLIMGEHKKLQQLMFDCEKFRFDNPEIEFFAGVSIAPNSTVEDIEILIEALDEFDFILFNTNDDKKQSTIVQKYAPKAKISMKL